jgi:hypothetical protein
LWNDVTFCVRNFPEENFRQKVVTFPKFSQRFGKKSSDKTFSDAKNLANSQTFGKKFSETKTFGRKFRKHK